MQKDLLRLIAFRAFSPENGGVGEKDKARELERIMLEKEFPSPERYIARVLDSDNVEHPNLIFRIPGKSDRKLFIVTHMDVVPEGDPSSWTVDPFKGKIDGSRVYGRGVNDNGQELVASIYAALALRELGIQPALEICLCFVSDEETGSIYGIQHLINKGIFSPDDLVIVPDGGNERGDFVEVAEKGILWIRLEVQGKQCHASMPHLGLNACRVANRLSVELDEALHKAFPDEDHLFDPPFSTMEPTTRESHAGSVNIVPGKEAFSFDCRILPSIPLDSVLDVIREKCRDLSHEMKGKIHLEILQRNDPAEPTPKNSEVVELLCRSLRRVYSFTPRVGGIGGGTCAAFFRKAGIPAVVWAQEADVAHMPDEYCETGHMLNEALVLALMMQG